MSVFLMRDWPERPYEIDFFKINRKHEKVIRKFSMFSWKIARGPIISSAEPYFEKTYVLHVPA